MKTPEPAILIQLVARNQHLLWEFIEHFKIILGCTKHLNYNPTLAPQYKNKNMIIQENLFSQNQTNGFKYIFEWIGLKAFLLNNFKEDTQGSYTQYICNMFPEPYYYIY